MLNKLNQIRNSREEGFTLIELLVVIVIIGVLAAIALPIFLNQQKAALEATVKSDVRTGVINIQTALTKKPTAPTADLVAAITASPTTGKNVLQLRKGFQSVSNGDGTATLEFLGGVGADADPTWQRYAVVGFTTDLGFSNFRYIFDSTTGKYTAFRAAPSGDYFVSSN